MGKIKQKINKLKEKWFWFTHPNLEYQVNVIEEKEIWQKILAGDEWKKYLTLEEKKNY